MTKSNKGKIIETATEYSGVATGAAVGAAIGTAVAGPVGAIGGSVIGTTIEKVFNHIGTELTERYLSKSETKKIKTVYEVALEKVSQNLKAGRKLRTDNFLRTEINDRSSAEEVFEGTIFAAQRENEEKKLSYLANLYANINFDETISRPMANQLIKIASSVSFRQIVLLSIIGKSNHKILDIPLRTTNFQGFDNYNDMSIAAEIFDLYRMSLIISSDAILDASSFTPSLLVLNGMGELLYFHMELFDMPLEETGKEIINFLINVSSSSQENIVVGQIPTVASENIINLFQQELANIPQTEIFTKDNDTGKTLVINNPRLADIESTNET